MKNIKTTTEMCVIFHVEFCDDLNIGNRLFLLSRS